MCPWFKEELKYYAKTWKAYTAGNITFDQYNAVFNQLNNSEEFTRWAMAIRLFCRQMDTIHQSVLKPGEQFEPDRLGL